MCWCHLNATNLNWGEAAGKTNALVLPAVLHGTSPFWSLRDNLGDLCCWKQYSLPGNWVSLARLGLDVFCWETLNTSSNNSCRNQHAPEMNDNTPEVKKKFYCKYSTKKSVYNCNVTWSKQQRNNKNIKTAKSWQSFPYSTKYHKIQIIQSVQILIKIQYTRVVCVFHSSRVFCCTEDKAKAHPLLFLQRQIQKQPFTTMLSTEGLERAGYFLLLITADALIWARIWSRIGVPPSWALPNSRLIGICPKLKCVLVWWPENLQHFLCWENPSLHWEKIHKRQTTLYRHIWGIRGKETWGEKLSSTPQDLIYFWCGAQPQWGTAHFKLSWKTEARLTWK